MTTPSPNPYVATFPYLPLRDASAFGDWWIGPLDDYLGDWASPELEEATRRFLACFRLPTGAGLDRPTVLARMMDGIDGQLPSTSEIEALVLSVQFATIDANPFWNPESMYSGWSVATTDNADLWLQPLDLAGGHIALDRGSRVRITAGGHSINDPSFTIAGPLELTMPTRISLDGELLEACYDTLLRQRGDDVALAQSAGVAVRWLAKAWANSASISDEDRLVFLKTATEGLTGTDKSIDSARILRDRYATCLTQDGEGVGADDLLWTPAEPSFERSWTRGGRSGVTRLSAFEHWYMAFADARNAIAHRGRAKTLGYECPGSPYEGPFVDVADRVLRELITLTLGLCGHPAVWRRGLGRASYRIREHLTQLEGGT